MEENNENNKKINENFSFETEFSKTEIQTINSLKKNYFHSKITKNFYEFTNLQFFSRKKKK